MCLKKRDLRFELVIKLNILFSIEVLMNVTKNNVSVAINDLEKKCFTFGTFLSAQNIHFQNAA